MVQVSYEYDAYNQLVKETYQNGDVIEYSYDNGGNLLSKTVNGVVSNSYAYGDTEWKDLLTGFNGTTITYDEIGNPQNWRDGMSFTWVNGRQLGALQKGDLNVSYSYNSDGLRVSKTVNGVKTEYVWDGSSLIGQKTGNNVLVYLYAADGLAGFQYNGVNYYYLRNGQGDVVAILNASGNIVAKYAYDAWGKLLNVTDAAGNDKSSDASFIGNINPVRYRSYYYDTETGLYYLQSRYYDPEVGRFINADGVLGANEDMMAYNLFAYCSNNPINMSDPSGKVSFIVGLIIGVVASWVADGVLEATTGYGGGHWVAEGLKSLQSVLKNLMNWAFEKEHEKELGPDVPQHIPGPDDNKSYYIWKEKEDEYYQVRYGYQPDVAGYEPSISDLIKYNIIPYRSNYRLSEDGTKIVWDSAAGD